MMELDELSLRRARVRYQTLRQGLGYARAFQKPDPKVSVLVSTYNNADRLCGRALPSLLAQTWKNLEIIVVGDGCTDSTARRVADLGDGRIRFCNLAPRRDPAPQGAAPTEWGHCSNRALEMAGGDFITHLDDSDVHAPNRLELLIRCARKEKADFIFHPYLRESGSGVWSLVQSPDGGLRRASLTQGATFYHHYFRDLPWDLDSWSKFGEPQDWNRLRTLAAFQPRVRSLSEPLLRRFNPDPHPAASAPPRVAEAA